MAPTASVWTGTPAASAADWMAAAVSRAASAASCQAPVASASRNSASPAAIASGLPESVPAWYTGPDGAIISMTSARPP